MRLRRQELRDLIADVGQYHDTKITGADGRQRDALPGRRFDVIVALIDIVGWGGRDCVSLADLARRGRTSEDTVSRALRDARAIGWVSWETRFETGPDGRRRNLPSRFTLHAPKPQNAAGLPLRTESRLSFLLALRRREAEARKAARQVVRVDLTGEQRAAMEARLAMQRSWMEENPLHRG
jgi:hypothetical protein